MCLLFLAISISSNTLNAKPISIQLNKLSLNGNIKETSDKDKIFFLILHGTFAWHGMELPAALQELLSDEGYGSLAFTLSLGENNRVGFFDCSHPIISGHDDAQQEIDAWLKKLEKLGYKNIALIGHSRGGAQVATFASKNSNRIKAAFLIAPLIWSQQKQQVAYRKNAKVDLNKLLKKLKPSEQLELESQDILHCKNATISNRAFHSYYSPIPEKNTPNILKSINLPTKIYLGDSDPLTIGFKAQFSQYSNNEMVTQMLVEDADHYFRDFAVEEIVSDILEMITKLEK